MVHAYSSSRCVLLLLPFVGFRHAWSWEVGGSEVKNGLNTLEAVIKTVVSVVEASHSTSDKTHFSSQRKMADEAAPSWIERGHANLVGASDFDKFGASSSLSANGLVLAVGAPYSNGGGAGQDSGSVQVYDYTDGNSYQPRGPAINGTELGDTFGWSVSLSNDGEVLAVGAPKSNMIGYVKVFKYDGTKYNEVINIVSPISTFAGDLFGYSISLSGDGKSLAIGMPLRKDAGGLVYLYGIDAETGEITSFPEYEAFYGDGVAVSELGYSVSISDDGNVLAAGDSRFSEVQVHQFDGFKYQLVCTILGEAVTVSGDGTRFAVRNETSAIVSVFTINAAEAECLQLGQAIPITTSPPPSSDSYDPTELMSLSNDGHVLAVVNPLDTNGVQVYEEIYHASGQLEYAARGDAIVIGNSTAVSLSDDGKVLAIGVPFLDLGNGQFEDNGSMHVYEWPYQTMSDGPTLRPTSFPTLTLIDVSTSLPTLFPPPPPTSPPITTVPTAFPTLPPTPPPTFPPITTIPTNNEDIASGTVCVENTFGYLLGFLLWLLLDP